MRWTGHIARKGESRGAYRVLVVKYDGKRPLGRPRRRWEDNIKMDIPAVVCEDMDWIDLAQDRWRALGNVVMNLQVPQNVGNFWTSREPVSFSRMTLLHGVSIAASNCICFIYIKINQIPYILLSYFSMYKSELRHFIVQMVA